MQATLFLPTLNEEHGLLNVMSRVDPALFCQVLVSDGGSTDRTREIARERGYEVHCQKGPGIRHAYIEAWPLIRGDLVITFSPDGNCKPEDLPRLLAMLREGYDMVVASRYLPPAVSNDDDLITGFGNRLFTLTVNVLHGGRYTDAMGIYRGYRRELFCELGLDRDDAYRTVEKLYRTTIGIEPLLSVRAVRAGKKIIEIASDEPAREGGVSKLQVFKWGAAYYTQFFLELFSTGWIVKHQERGMKKGVLALCIPQSQEIPGGSK